MTSSTLPALSAVVLPDRHPVSAFLDDVRAVEAAGVGTVWTYDHLSWPTLRDGAWYGSVPLLAAAAAVTSTVRLGLQVASPNFRHPVPFAKELMTLDQLSGGRLEVGVGAGTEGPDATVLGDAPLSRRERFERFAEWLALLDELLREPVTTLRGSRYAAVDARQLPGCVQQPRVPFTVAGAGPRALGAVASVGQAWVTFGPVGETVDEARWFAALGEQSARLTAALQAAGRPADDVHRIALLDLDAHWPFSSRQRYVETVSRLADLGFDEVSVHWPRPDGRGVPAPVLASVLAVHG
jgi:alkanesulfonate monooxygenase SsuD/methylene tetrahydromethanopterin reductase-like flavin-dependent oxidoreductase (luciferase family)